MNGVQNHAVFGSGFPTASWINQLKRLAARIGFFRPAAKYAIDNAVEYQSKIVMVSKVVYSAKDHANLYLCKCFDKSTHTEHLKLVSEDELSPVDWYRTLKTFRK
jgi:hypothetical protein